MATFEVKVVKIDDVMEHPDADRLTLIKIGGYTCIANKHEDGSWRYQAGDLVVYIPENALVPEWLLRRQGMWNDERGKGIMSGKMGDRVKAIRLRGIFSEGILYPVQSEDNQCATNEHFITVQTDEGYDIHPTVTEGMDVAELLGITKYEPPIPSSMNGELWNFGRAPCNFDLEPYEKHTDLLLEDELVVMTEKLHGTFTGISIFRGLEHEDATPLPGGMAAVVYSKGLGSKGLVFKDNEANATNLYMQTMKRLIETPEFLQWLDDVMKPNIDVLHILGETYGKGVQDLDYGSAVKEFSIFLIGWQDSEREPIQWVSPTVIQDHAKDMGAKSVPILYSGVFDEDIMIEHRDGKTTLGGDHVREGVVIYLMVGRSTPEFGTVRLKAVSPDYKLRKGGTEYN